MATAPVAAPVHTEWDASGNPIIQSTAAPAPQHTEWDAEGNPIAAAQNKPQTNATPAPTPAAPASLWDKIGNYTTAAFDLANPDIAAGEEALGHASSKLQQFVENRRQANLVAAANARHLPYHEAANQFLQDLASTSQFVQGLGTPKNLALTAALMVPYVDVPASMYLVGEGTEQATKPQEEGETQADHYQRVLSGLGEMAGGVAGSLKGAGEFAKSPDKVKAFKAEHAAKTQQTIRGLEQVRDAGMRELRQNILESVDRAHEEGVKAPVERINTAHEAQIAKDGIRRAGIDVSSEAKAIDAARDIYQQIGQATPGADAIQKRLSNLPDKLTFEEAKQLRSDIGKAMKIAGPQRGIMGKAYANLSDLMAAKARELGLPNAYENYNNTFRSLVSDHPADVDTSLAPTIKAIEETPAADLYNHLKTHPGQFDELQRSLEKFGLKPNIITDSVQNFDKAMKYIKDAGKGANFMGVLRSVSQRPIRALAAYHAGHLAGGFVGGYVALSILNDLAEHAEAAEELKRLGGASGVRDLLPQKGPDTPSTPVPGGATIGEQLTAKGQTIPSNGAPAPSEAGEQAARDIASKKAVSQSLQHIGAERRSEARSGPAWEPTTRAEYLKKLEEMGFSTEKGLNASGVGGERTANAGKMPEGMEGVLVDKGEPSKNPTRESKNEAAAVKLLKDRGYEIKKAAPKSTTSEPVKIGLDESGNIVDADGRHRVIQAIKNGDKTIKVMVNVRHGGIQTLDLDPKTVAKIIGVTEESLKETDEQQSQFNKKKPAAD